MRSGTDYKIIEIYNKAIECVEETQDPAFCIDQQVPEAQFATTLSSIKTEIKTEKTHEQHLCSPADMLLMDRYNYGSDDVTLTEVNCQLNDFTRTSSFLTSQPDYLWTNLKDFPQASTPLSSDSSTTYAMYSSMPLSSTLSNAVSSQQSPTPMESSGLSSSMSFSSSPKTTTYITERAGSGGTVTTNPNFLIDMNLQEEVEYTDLDRVVTDLDRGVALYDDFVKPHVHSNTKNSTKMQESWENGLSDQSVFNTIYSTIYEDSIRLQIPYDPSTWTCEDASIWIRWVCKKENLCDLTREIATFHDGQTLCSWKEEDFSNHFGQSGTYLYADLDLWKAVNIYSLLQNKSPLADPACPTNVSTQNGFPVDGNSFSCSPASSPALSPCSSTDSDSSNAILSQLMDVPHDDSPFHPEVKPSSNSDSSDDNKIFQKRVPGRGHKKCIALWQFLRKLLQSEQNYGCIRWIDRKTGIFKIEDSKKVAILWGSEKNRPAMNYDKLSRSVRQYYKKGIIKKPAQPKRLLYQFCPEYL